MMNDVPVFYDCEASCIGGLPIEIGWAFIDTSTGEIQSESHLVKPSLHWDIQPVWDPDAEKLHGISLEQLHAQRRRVMFENRCLLFIRAAYKHNKLAPFSKKKINRV
jgi:hypothetical protein